MLEKGNFTFTMIKPVAVKRGDIGSIIQIMEEKGFRIAAIKKMLFSKELAEEFYAEHKGKEYFEGLTDFMTSGAIIALVLEKENAVLDYRKVIGSTNPKDAEDGTIRKLFAETMRKNAVHGSDANESALRETKLIFTESEIF
jgi:nucleoside-diphosphate kinase